MDVTIRNRNIIIDDSQNLSTGYDRPTVSWSWSQLNTYAMCLVILQISHVLIIIHSACSVLLMIVSHEALSNDGENALTSVHLCICHSQKEMLKLCRFSTYIEIFIFCR